MKAASPDRFRTRLSSKGQVVLPKALRDRVHLAPGAELEVWEEGDHLALKAVPREDWRSLAGCLSGVDLVADLEAEHAREMEREGAGQAE